MAKEANTEEQKGIVEAHFEELGAKTRDNLSKGGNPVVINLVDKVNVQFTKDFGFMKKGHVQEVSETAYEIYKKAGVIEKL